MCGSWIPEKTEAKVSEVKPKRQEVKKPARVGKIQAQKLGRQKFLETV